MSSAEWWPFCPGRDELAEHISEYIFGNAGSQYSCHAWLFSQRQLLGDIYV